MPVLNALKFRRPAPSSAAGILLSRARAAQAEGRIAQSAALYQEAVLLVPDDRSARIQFGHMLKDSGRYAEAEVQYAAARALRGDDADLELQFGHLYKLAGRLDEAEAAYRRAVELKPGWPVPVAELAHLDRSGWLGRRADMLAGSAALDTRRLNGAVLDEDPGIVDAMRVGSAIEGLVPALVPQPASALLHAHRDHIEVRRLGRMEAGYWGDARTLRGVEAIRGFVISGKPILDLQIIMNGLTIHQGPVAGGYPLAFEIEPDLRRKYVYNVWIDFGSYANGRYAIELKFFDADGTTRSYHDRVVVADPLCEADFPTSDAVVEIGDRAGGSVEQRVNARESMVRPAERSLFPTPPRAILVQRTDQLGDMVSSIPAMLRLRELFPEARIVGLLTAANEAFANTLDLFDEIIVIDFPDDPVERRRLMPLDVQQALRDRLAPYAFDIALDLAQSHVSRPLLRLSGARFTLGVGESEWPWLSANFVFNTHDPLTNLDMVPHSTKVLAMIESLGAVTRRSAKVMRRPDLSRAQLAAYGIGPDDRYVVLHAGARVLFSRWPHYPALARLILERTDCKVVMLTEDPAVRATLPADLVASDRFLFLDQRLPFDDFDAIISFCDAMVGNDSGPKHLASLRGVNIVTLFTNRINWTEWGQEMGGKVITRRVPCAGCLIFHDADECGKDFACIVLISPEEVFGAIREYLLPSAT